MMIKQTWDKYLMFQNMKPEEQSAFELSEDFSWEHLLYNLIFGVFNHFISW